MSSSSPQLAKGDSLQQIIYLSEWYFKSKFIRWSSYYSSVCGICYINLLFYNMVLKPENIREFDVLIGALSLEVILSSLSLYDEKPEIDSINQLKNRFFWNADFFTPQEKLVNERDVKIYIIFHWILWFLAILLLFVLIFIFSLPEFLYNNNWPFSLIQIIKILFFVYYITGYYIGNSHECWYAYVILHGYYQMKVIVVYLRQEFLKYKEMTFIEKIDCEEYQKAIELVFLRCIQQHQRLTEYGTKIAVMYRKWIIWHFIIAVFTLSVALHWMLFDTKHNKLILLAGIPHFVLGSLLYISIGQLFSEAYNDFHKALLNVKWYTLNKTNQKLYYTTLIFTQKEFGIQILPSVTLTRPVLTSFVKTIYGGITLLRSIQK